MSAPPEAASASASEGGRGPIVVAVLNQKGGVGKTSTTWHLGGALATLEEPVLVVDNDPQCSLTQGILGPEAAESIPRHLTLDGVYRGIGEVALSLGSSGGGLWYYPGSWALADLNTTRPPGGWPGEYLGALRHLVRSYNLWRHYRWVLIDCPPNLQLLSAAALCAADLLLVPVQAEDYGVQGVRAVAAFAREVRCSANPALAEPVYLVTQFDKRCRLPHEYLAELRALHGKAVLETVVPRAVDFPEAVVHRQPVTRYRARSAAADAMRRLAFELSVRVSARGCGRLEEEATR